MYSWNLPPLLSFQGTQSFSGDGLPETHCPDALHHDLELRGHRQGHRNGPLGPVPHGTAAAATDLLKEAPPGEGRLMLQATQQGRQLLVSQHCQGSWELTNSLCRLRLETLYFCDVLEPFPASSLKKTCVSKYRQSCMALSVWYVAPSWKPTERSSTLKPVKCATIWDPGQYRQSKVAAMTLPSSKTTTAWGQRSQSNGGIGWCQRRSEWQPDDGIQHMNGFMCFCRVDEAEHADKLMFISLER